MGVTVRRVRVRAGRFLLMTRTEGIERARKRVLLAVATRVGVRHLVIRVRVRVRTIF